MRSPMQVNIDTNDMTATLLRSTDKLALTRSMLVLQQQPSAGVHLMMAQIECCTFHCGMTFLQVGHVAGSCQASAHCDPQCCSESAPQKREQAYHRRYPGPASASCRSAAGCYLRCVSSWRSWVVRGFVAALVWSLVDEPDPRGQPCAAAVTWGARASVVMLERRRLHAY